jgi:hypothetical protein
MVVLLLAGCFFGIGHRDLPPRMFARDEHGDVVVYRADCEQSPKFYDRIELNRIDTVRRSDGRIERFDTTTIWRATADDRTGPVPLPERLPLFSPPQGMHDDAEGPNPELDVDATYRLVAFGPDTVQDTTFVIDELRQISGQFDLVGRRFDDPTAMSEYACSKAFTDAWESSK